MITGEMPCCGKGFMLLVPDGDLPQYWKEICQHCNVAVWHKLSRIDPESWTEEDFLKAHIIDYENKLIKNKKDEL